MLFQGDFKQYFTLFPDYLKPKRRERYKAQSPLNNLLNLGYEVLKGEVYKAVLNAHLDPYLPDNTVFHTNHYTSAGILKLFRYNRIPFTKTPCTYSNKTGITKR